MRNCVKRKKIWQKESYKPVAVVVQPPPHTAPLGDDFGPDLPLPFKLHEIWLVAFLEYRQNRSHQMSDFMAKMHQIRLQLGLRPRPRWGSLQRSPRPQAGFNGAYFSANLFTVDSRRVVTAR